MKVCGLIVTFEPIQDVIETTIRSLTMNSVESIYVFDNSDKNRASVKSICEKLGCIYLGGKGNIGIAAAQNKLIYKACRDGFDFVILSDQDSEYPNNYIFEMKKVFELASNIVAICPGWYALDTSGSLRFQGQYCLDQRLNLVLSFRTDSPYRISHAIASGMLINVQMFNLVGGMREDLFIDWVDNEWCWRAYLKGLAIYTQPSVKIIHSLGEGVSTVLGRSFSTRPAIRNYYIVRNAIFLARTQSDYPKSIKLYLIKKAVHHAIFSFITSKRPFVELKVIAKAFKHGFSNRL